MGAAMIFSPVFAHLNSLDIMLVVFLAIGLPLLQWLNSKRSVPGAPHNMAQRYRRNMTVLGLPLLLLAFDWLGADRSASMLGLALPPPLLGKAGLVLAAIAVLAMVLSDRLNWPRRLPELRAAVQAKLKTAGMAPQTRIEVLLWVQLAVLIGCGGEILFRGFLVWCFAPLAGTVVAVILAALIYAIAHGAKDWKGWLATIISALAFTGAFALTVSLWWLMAIHTFIAFYAGWSAYRFGR